MKRKKYFKSNIFLLVMKYLLKDNFLTHLKAFSLTRRPGHLQVSVWI